MTPRVRAGRWSDDELDELMGQALELASLMRDDLSAAHRWVAYAPEDTLAAVTWVLAAAFPIDMPLDRLAWWRLLPAPNTS
jgi:hypothetical protein